MITIDKEVPNQQTLATLVEYKEMKAHPKQYKRYSTFQEVLEEVLIED